ncbi:MAG TPA: serine/threonine-protein kinase [Labilithrix sp.]|nr:serine/threonine-protein kinase [Labilithrix sp.]
MALPDLIAPVLPGETLAGKYRVERILGRGGMGIVVAARHLELDERVAIKFLLRANDPASLARFLREARAAAKVKSEHVCRVYDVGRLETGEPYLVMECLEGVDLGQRLAKKGRAPLADVAGWMIEACAALSEAHALGIVHRDLKPANLFLAARGDGTTCVKILDFGISKLPASEGMTSTTALIGSPVYMSPEQLVSARTVDQRADVWSIGVMLHELVTGLPPFSAESVIQLSVKIREAVPAAPSSIIGTLPRAFDTVVGKCLAKDPVERFASMRELALALAPFAAPEARRLAARIRRERGSAVGASTLVATWLDDGDGVHLRNPSSEPPGTSESMGDGVGQVTFEPLSGGDSPENRRAGRWLPAAVLVLASIGALVGGRQCGSPSHANAKPAPPADVTALPDIGPPSIVVSEVLPLPVIVTGASESSQPPRPPRPPMPSSKAAPPAAVTRAEDLGALPLPSAPTPTLSASAESSAQPITSSSAFAPPPALDASGRRRRVLDRTDPYEH